MFTACVITRDSQKKLEKCLQNLCAYDIPVAVVDTGSLDDSIAVARRYTDNVSCFPWKDDFSAAKNYAIDRAETDFVMVVDSDEYLMEMDMQGLCRQMEGAPHMVGRVKLVNHYYIGGEERISEEWISRIFHKGKFRYEGRIHEQVTEVHGNPYETYTVDVVLDHDGYQLTGQKRAEKVGRNIRLLEAELDRFLAEHGEKDLSLASPEIQNEGAYLLYQLGRSYYMQEEYAIAAEYFATALEFDLDERLEYVADLVETYGYALLNSGQEQQALNLEGVYDTFANHADFCFLMGMVYMNNLRFDDGVREFEKAATFSDAKIRGVNSYLAYYNAGVIRECQGRTKEAISYYEKAQGYKKAIDELAKLKNRI